MLRSLCMNAAMFLTVRSGSASMVMNVPLPTSAKPGIVPGSIL
jgi:hypothetical protein